MKFVLRRGYVRGKYIQVLALTCWDDGCIFSFSHLTSLLSAGLWSSSFVERQDAISPTMGVELCKAALANHKGSKFKGGLVWVGLKSTSIWCIKQVPHDSKKTHSEVLEKECPKDYLYTNDTVDCSEIQILNHHWKDVVFFKSQWKNWNMFKKKGHGFKNHPTGMGIWTNNDWPTPWSKLGNLSSVDQQIEETPSRLGFEPLVSGIVNLTIIVYS